MHSTDQSVLILLICERGRLWRGRKEGSTYDIPRDRRDVVAAGFIQYCYQRLEVVFVLCVQSHVRPRRRQRIVEFI